MPKDTHKNQQLNQEIKTLTKEIKLLNSFPRRLALGVVTGVGTAIGATIVASVVIAILAQAIQSINDVPILNKLIQSQEIQQVLGIQENNQ